MTDRLNVGASLAPPRFAATEWLSRWFRRRRWLLFLPLLVLLSIFTVVPLLTVFIGSFRPDGLPVGNGWTLEHYVDVWGDRYTYRLVANTLIFASLSAAIAIALALALSWVLERTDLPWRNVFRAAIIMPMVTPPLLLAIGWVLVLSPRIGLLPGALRWLFGPMEWFQFYSLPGMIFVQALAYVPTSVLIFSPIIRNMDPAYEEAAGVAGAGPWQTVWRVSLPFLLPAIVSTATLLMIVGMLAFDVPAIIGMPNNVEVMSSEIFRYMNPPLGLPEYGKSAAMNTSLFILLMIGLVVYFRAIRTGERFATISGKGYKATPFRLGRWQPAALTFVGGYFVLAVALPFLALLWASLIPYFSGFDASLADRLSFAAYERVLSNTRVWRAAINALEVAVIATFGVVVAGLLLSWLVVRSRSRLAWLIDVLSMIPIGVPHLMMAVALIFLVFTTKLPIYGSIWIMALGYVIIYLPLGSRMMQAGIMQIHRELEEAATVAGASVIQNLWGVVQPLLRPAIVALMIWTIVHSLREFSIAVMLQSGRNEVLSTILYAFWEGGKPADAAAISMLLMTGLGLFVVCLHRFTGSQPQH